MSYASGCRAYWRSGSCSARRYATLAKRATDDTSLTWHLSGKIVAAARDGVPVPELVFPIAGYLRRSLTAIPPARLVQ